MTATGFAIRHARDGDEDGIVGLINRAFSQHDPAFRQLGRAWFDWKYARNPQGRQNLVLEDQTGRIVGHYGGVPMRLWTPAGFVVFGQNCDSVTDPDLRRGLRNPGAFVRIAQAYASTFSGRDRNAVMYGLPIPDAYRVGARYLDYWMLRAQPILACRSSERLPPWAPEIHAVEVESFDGDDASALFARSVDPERIVAVRDAAFLNWRFRDHWDRPYRFAIARPGEGGASLGYVVYRTGLFAGRIVGVIVDWLVDRAAPRAAQSLLRWATERAAQDGHAELVAVFPPTSAWFRRFQDFGFEVDRSPYVMVARPYDPAFHPDLLRRDWEYTLAEFDIA